MPDIAANHLAALAALLISIAGLVWIALRAKCRARRLEAQRRVSEARYHEAQEALDRAIRRRRDRERHPDFRYTPE